jgi:hypothetical protein
MMNGLEDAQKVGRQTVDRALQSFGAMSRGWQALANETAGLSKQAFEDGAAHVEKLLGAKSLDVAVEAQSAYVKSTYEKAAGRLARMGELYLDLVKDAAKPFEDMVSTAAK